VRLRGRSYIAFVFSPFMRIVNWLEEIDATLTRSFGFSSSVRAAARTTQARPPLVAYGKHRCLDRTGVWKQERRFQRRGGWSQSFLVGRRIVLDLPSVDLASTAASLYPASFFTPSITFCSLVVAVDGIKFQVPQGSIPRLRDATRRAMAETENADAAALRGWPKISRYSGSKSELAELRFAVHRRPMSQLTSM
jgi:hypothetical protein